MDAELSSISLYYLEKDERDYLDLVFQRLRRGTKAKESVSKSETEADDEEQTQPQEAQARP